MEKKQTTLGKLLCWIGLHKWGKRFGFDQHSSNVIDWKSRCERCDIVKKWVGAKPNNYGQKRDKDEFSY